MVNLTFSQDKIHEGDKFSVTCNSRAYPENVAYKWFFNGVELKGERNETLMIEAITRDHHNSDVKCSVANEVGRTESAASLRLVLASHWSMHLSTRLSLVNTLQYSPLIGQYTSVLASHWSIF